MSQDEKDEKSGAEIIEMFSRAQKARVEPSPHLSAYVVAELERRARQARSLFLWKSAATAFAALALILGGLYWNAAKLSGPAFFTDRSYVIQTDFDAQDTAVISQVEAELPPDVYFVSSEGPVKESRMIKLPYEVRRAGMNRLPFVVSSGASGKKEIVLRFFDDKDQIRREKKLTLEFFKNKS